SCLWVGPPGSGPVLQLQVAIGYRHPRAHYVAVGLGPNQKDLQPMMSIAPVIAEQLRRLTVVAYQNIQVAVVVEIAHGGSATDAAQLEVRPQLAAHVFEGAPARVAEHELRFGVLSIGVIELDVVKDVAVGHEDVAGAVVVV